MSLVSSSTTSSHVQLASNFFFGQDFSLASFNVLFESVLPPRPVITMSAGIVFYLVVNSFDVAFQLSFSRSPIITLCTTPVLSFVMDIFNVLLEVPL